MTETNAVLTTLNAPQLAEITLMLQTLVKKGFITRAQADETAERIAHNYGLDPLYLW